MKRKLEQGWDHDEPPSRQLLTHIERDGGDPAVGGETGQFYPSSNVPALFSLTANTVGCIYHAPRTLHHKNV